MALEVVGMQFDEAGDQKVAVEILAVRGGAGINGGQLSVRDQHRTGDDLVGKHDAGIA